MLAGTWWRLVTSSPWSWSSGTRPTRWAPALTASPCASSASPRWTDHSSVQSARCNYRKKWSLFKSHYQCMFTRFQFPLCGPKCVDKKLHKAECEIFAKIEKKINFSNLTEKHPVYTTIAPLRQDHPSNEHFTPHLV